MPLPTEQPPKWYIYHICCDLHFDLLTPNSNKFMYVPRHTSNNSLEKIHQHILELSQTQTPKIAFFSHIYIFGHVVTDLWLFKPTTLSVISNPRWTTSKGLVKIHQFTPWISQKQHPGQTHAQVFCWEQSLHPNSTQQNTEILWLSIISRICM